MTELDQLRERNKELERLVELTKPYWSRYCVVLATDPDCYEAYALYARLFPPAPPEAKYAIGQFVKIIRHRRAEAYLITKSQFEAPEWRYAIRGENAFCWRESELSALSEEEATGK